MTLWTILIQLKYYNVLIINHQCFINRLSLASTSSSNFNWSRIGCALDVDFFYEIWDSLNNTETFLTEFVKLIRFVGVFNQGGGILYYILSMSKFNR